MVLFCMSDANKDPWMGPERLSRADLERLFSVRDPYLIYLSNAANIEQHFANPQ